MNVFRDLSVGKFVIYGFFVFMICVAENKDHYHLIYINYTFFLLLVFFITAILLFFVYANNNCSNIIAKKITTIKNS